MEKLLKNPLVIGGALIGAYYLLKKQPESRVSRTIGAVRDLGESVIDTTIDAGTDIISGVYETTQDIFGIYDNEELPSIDNGIDGSDSTLIVDDENAEETEVDGSGFSGGTSRMSRGFSGEELDYNMEF